MNELSPNPHNTDIQIPGPLETYENRAHTLDAEVSEDHQALVESVAAHAGAFAVRIDTHPKGIAIGHYIRTGETAYADLSEMFAAPSGDSMRTLLSKRNLNLDWSSASGKSSAVLRILARRYLEKARFRGLYSDLLDCGNTPSENPGNPDDTIYGRGAFQVQKPESFDDYLN